MAPWIRNQAPGTETRLSVYNVKLIEYQTILCFASGYGAPPTSKHHVMHLLARHNTVLWVNYHGSRAPSASKSDMMYMFRKLVEVVRGLKNPHMNLYVLTPLVLPLPNKSWAQRFNRVILAWQIKRALSKVRAGSLQIWSFTPDISYLLDDFDAEKVVYYCVDDHAAFTGYDSEQVLRDEMDLCRRADLVVTSSSALQDAKKSWNAHTLLMPHGVDYDHFCQAVSENLPVPADIADIPRPRLGFFGLIRDWVDVDMLSAVAQKRPEWHFVLIGDSTIDLEPYCVRPNLHFLGRKPYAELPAYCQQFDVGLIPFKVNELTRAVNPIKLREYLAAGLPVVSTPMPEVQQYAHLIGISDSVDSFISAVEVALAGDVDARDARSEAMRCETWPEKVAIICDYIEGHSRFEKEKPV